MALTVATFVERVRRHLYGASRSGYNSLQTTIDSDDTAVVLSTDVTGMARTQIIGIDYELMYVSAVATSSNTLTVIRGFMGTTPAAHTSGALVEIDPRFPKAAIRDTLIEELDSYYPEVFNPVHFTIGAETTGRRVDLADAFSSLPSVGREPTRLLWCRAAYTGDTYDARPHVPATLQVTREYDGEPAYYLLLEGFLPESADLDIAIAFPITAFIDTDTSSFDGIDLQAQPGVRREVIDTAVYGVAWRLLSTREVPRTSVSGQNQSRMAEEVPPEHINRTAAALKRQRDMMLNHVHRLYLDLYPPRRVGL